MVADLALDLLGEEIDPLAHLGHVHGHELEPLCPPSQPGHGVEHVVEEHLLQDLAPLLAGDVAERHHGEAGALDGDGRGADVEFQRAAGREVAADQALGLDRARARLAGEDGAQRTAGGAGGPGPAATGSPRAGAVEELPRPPPDQVLRRPDLGHAAVERHDLPVRIQHHQDRVSDLEHGRDHRALADGRGERVHPTPHLPFTPSRRPPSGCPRAPGIAPRADARRWRSPPRSPWPRPVTRGVAAAGPGGRLPRRRAGSRGPGGWHAAPRRGRRGARARRAGFSSFPVRTSPSKLKRSADAAASRAASAATSASRNARAARATWARSGSPRRRPCGSAPASPRARGGLPAASRPADACPPGASPASCASGAPRGVSWATCASPSPAGWTGSTCPRKSARAGARSSNGYIGGRSLC